MRPESAARALQGVQPVLKDLEARTPKSKPKPTGRYGSDEWGDPIHYDPKLHPPGSVIESECPAANTGGMYRPTETELREREFDLWCGRCDAPFRSRGAFFAHRDAVHDGSALFTNHPPGTPPIVIGQRKNGRRADGEIRSTSIDPLGRTIVARTDAQIRREAERHGVEIVKGRGA